MGFLSPPTDYVEDRLAVYYLYCFDKKCQLIETSCVFAVINVNIKASNCNTQLAPIDGRKQFVKLLSVVRITKEGEDMAAHGIKTRTLKLAGEGRNIV